MHAPLYQYVGGQRSYFPLLWEISHRTLINIRDLKIPLLLHSLIDLSPLPLLIFTRFSYNEVQKGVMEFYDELCDLMICGMLLSLFNSRSCGEHQLNKEPSFNGESALFNENSKAFNT